MAIGHSEKDCTSFYAKACDGKGYYYETLKETTAKKAEKAARALAKRQGDVTTIEVMGLSRNWKIWTELYSVSL